jgi:hypothetical protein
LNDFNGLRAKSLWVKLYHKVPEFVPFAIQLSNGISELFNKIEGLNPSTGICTEVPDFVSGSVVCVLASARALAHVQRGAKRTNKQLVE